MLDDVVDFDGFDRPRKLRVDVNSVSDFEKEAGQSIFEMLNAAENRLRIGNIRTLLWATMKADDRRLTIERVGVMMNDYLANGGQLQKLADALVEAINKSRLMTALAGASPNVEGGENATSLISENGSTSGS
jgi:hypothetical protein